MKYKSILKLKSKSFTYQTVYIKIWKFTTVFRKSGVSGSIGCCFRGHCQERTQFTGEYRLPYFPYSCLLFSFILKLHQMIRQGPLSLLSHPFSWMWGGLGWCGKSPQPRAVAILKYYLSGLRSQVLTIKSLLGQVFVIVRTQGGWHEPAKNKNEILLALAKFILQFPACSIKFILYVWNSEQHLKNMF